MAEGKKSFILYADLIHTVSKLPKEKAGELFLHILEYVNDKNPTTDDLILQLAFEPVKLQLKRDLEKWDDIRDLRKKAGKKSAEIRQQKQHMSTHVEFAEQNSTNANTAQHSSTNTTVTVNVNGTVNDTVNVNDNVSVINEPTPTQVHELFKQRFFSPESEYDREQICVSIHETQILESWAAEFNAHLHTESKWHHTYGEWKKHFRNWLDKSLSRIRKQDTGRQKSKIEQAMDVNKQAKELLKHGFGGKKQ